MVYSTRVIVLVMQKFQQQHNFGIPENNTVCYTVWPTRVLNRVTSNFCLFHVCLSNLQPRNFAGVPALFFFFCWSLSHILFFFCRNLGHILFFFFLLPKSRLHFLFLLLESQPHFLFLLPKSRPHFLFQMRESPPWVAHLNIHQIW